VLKIMRRGRIVQLRIVAGSWWKTGHGAVVTSLATVLVAGCAPPLPSPDPAHGPEERPYVIMVSVDGMHPAFLERVATPNFDRLAASGVTAEALIPVYPSKTFPNHYTIATGLYTERHGLVDNSFYDPELDAMYRLRDRDAVRDGRFYGGEPIWVTAERQGVTTASYFWVGTEAPVQGVQPTYFRYFDGSVPNEARVDTVLYWLRLPAVERPNLVMLYFSEPDATAHDHGPAAAAVDSAVMAIDGVLGRLLDGVAALPIAEQVHVVVVSDHGMAEVPEGNVIVLEELVDLTGVRAVYNTTQVLLYFDGQEARRQEVLVTLRQRLQNARVYPREETPARWRYRDNPRIGELVVVADLGWVLRWPGGGAFTARGMHGWDPHLPEMHGIFMAAGPRLRARERVPAFESVHVYPLLARLLDLEPAPGIDGRVEAISHLLRAPVTAP
jgi:predicted AlkP superfamily pyrophosphatase or phosphodiesterase